MPTVELTHEELLLLDGKVSPKTQAEVERSKIVLSTSLPLYLAEIIADSLKIGTLRWTFKSHQRCVKCGAQTRYAKYKSGRKTGQDNYDRPLHVYGPCFNEGFITIKNYSNRGFCSECGDDVIALLISHVRDNNLQIELQDLSKTQWVREEKKICFDCKKEMWEFDMGLRNTIMGNGYYHAVCPHPHCRAESLPFGKSHQLTKEFRLVPVGTLEKKVNCFVRSLE